VTNWCDRHWTRAATEVVAYTGCGKVVFGSRGVPSRSLQLYDGTNQGSGDPSYGLDVVYDKPSERIDVCRSDVGDHIVWAGNGFGGSHALDCADLVSDLSGLINLCLNQDVCLDQGCLFIEVKRPRRQ
jgi:hypothetical protein